MVKTMLSILLELQMWRATLFASPRLHKSLHDTTQKVSFKTTFCSLAERALLALFAVVARMIVPVHALLMIIAIMDGFAQRVPFTRKRQYVKRGMV